jgi:hypothetical protein
MRELGNQPIGFATDPEGLVQIHPPSAQSRHRGGPVDCRAILDVLDGHSTRKTPNKFGEIDPCDCR